MYVAFEGIDTCGKSTQLNILKGKRGDFVYTKEPGGTPLGEKIRELALNFAGIDEKSRFFLFLADRAEHIQKIILPNSGKILISDRSVISGIAYSIFGGLCKDFVLEASKIAVNSVLPDIVIILWMDETTLSSRLHNKTNDEIEKQGIQKLLQIQNEMPGICETLGIKYHKIDASQNIEAIAKQIEEIIG